MALRIFGVQLAIVAVLTALGRPELYLLWFGPYMTQWRVTNRLRAIAEHGGMERSPDRRRTTHHVRQSLLARVFMVPYNVGYHLAHHVDMGVPCWNLKALQRELEASGWVTDDLRPRELPLAVAGARLPPPRLRRVPRSTRRRLTARVAACRLAARPPRPGVATSRSGRPSAPAATATSSCSAFTRPSATFIRTVLAVDVDRLEATGRWPALDAVGPHPERPGLLPQDPPQRGQAGGVGQHGHHVPGPALLHHDRHQPGVVARPPRAAGPRRRRASRR